VSGRAPSALFVAALVGYVGEVAITLARGGEPSAGYLALCGALTLAAVLAMAGVARLARLGVASALGLWAAATVALALDDGTLRRVVISVLLGLGIGGALAWRRGARGTWLDGGASTAVACIMVLYAAPRVAYLIGMPPRGWLFGVASVLLGTLTVLAGGAWSRLRRSRRVPSESVASVVLLIGLTVAVQLTRPAASWRDGEARAAVPATPDRPDVLVLVLDTVRADRLSLYGHVRPTTPRLVRLVEGSRRAVAFPWAFAPASWTWPSHASLFTGTLPSDHGAHSRSRFAALDPLFADRTLAEALADRGYRTAAVFANPVLSFARQLRRGFDVCVQPAAARPLFLVGEGVRSRLVPWAAAWAIKPTPPARAVNAAVLEQLEACGDAPCFLIANYMEAHTPYAPRPEFEGRFTGEIRGAPPLDASLRYEEARNEHAALRYDEELLALDAALGELLDELERSGRLDRTWLFVTSDHGESFGEHEAFGHGTAIYNEQVRIPLIVQPPRGERVDPSPHAVGLLDVAATIAAIAGAGPLGEGRDLRAPDEDGAVRIEFFGHAPGTTDLGATGPLAARPARAVVQGTTKLLDYRDARELYALESDPNETRDLSRERGEEVGSLATLLPPLVDRNAPADEPERDLSPEELERLKALGYVD
jgi:arylsulfatase A-like enzyme